MKNIWNEYLSLFVGGPWAMSLFIPDIHSFIHSGYFFKSTTTQRRSQHSMDTVSEFHAKAQQATASEGLAQGPYVAARAGFEPMTLRMKGDESTNEPAPRLCDSAGPKHLEGRRVTLIIFCLTLYIYALLYILFQFSYCFRMVLVQLKQILSTK